MFNFFSLFKTNPAEKAFLENKELLKRVGIAYSKEQHDNYLKKLEARQREPLSLKGVVLKYFSGDYMGKDRFQKELHFISKTGLIRDYLTCLGDVVNQQMGLNEERREIRYFPPQPGAPTEESIWHLKVVDTQKTARVI